MPNKHYRRFSFQVALLMAALVTVSVPGGVRAQGVVYVHDGKNLPQHRVRGQAYAERDLKAGKTKFYVQICTFPPPERKEIRSFEIRQALYKASGITVMADLCNDIVPNGLQQSAFVEGYNAVMGAAITKRMGTAWQDGLEKQVLAELKKHPSGKLKASDIDFETPY
jgi:hypothetical protein